MNKQHKKNSDVKLTQQEHWDQQWDSFELKKNITKHALHDLFQKYLQKNNESEFIEIGCTPGLTMGYFQKYFGYKVSGIDYSETELTRKVLKFNNIDNCELYNIDFTKETINKEYDVVASFGFIEHFTNPDEIIKKHISLLKKNGVLILGIPNLRKIQYIMKYVFERDMLKLHNIATMDLDYLTNVIESNGLKIMFCNYNKTFDFWLDRDIIFKRYILLFFRLICAGLKITKLDNIPNRFLSPYIVVIARK